MGIRVSITRYISDDPHPGIVECELVDAHGHRHRFIDKTSIFTKTNIDAASTYPCDGEIRCSVTDPYRGPSGQEVIGVDIRLDGVESVDGLWQFEVAPASMID